MTRRTFNMAIAHNVMGYKLHGYESHEYPYGGMLVAGQWTPTPDFTRDHNAAAMVRERVNDLNYSTRMAFVSHLRATLGNFNAAALDLSYEDILEMLSATPEQTARAAYLAITGEELEAVDGE